MKRCWDPNPKKRPSLSEILSVLHGIIIGNCLIKLNLRGKSSKKIGPKFNENAHPKAIYTSRSLNSYISKYSSIKFHQMVCIIIGSHLWINKLNFFFIDYISNELELDIDIENNKSLQQDIILY
jgi:hypothetical protein